MDYRKYYEQYYGIKIPAQYDIHHMDLNRDNNSIDNLLLLPKDVHHRYHFCLNATRGDIKEKRINVEIRGNIANENNYDMEMVENLIYAIRECNKWYDYKMYLDGIIGNIHNIILEDTYSHE